MTSVETTAPFEGTAPFEDTAPFEATAPFDCPRCGSPAAEAFYGPCAACRADLRARHGGEARTVEAAAYEPKMNVTPNAVALKD